MCSNEKRILMLLTNPFRPDPRVYEEAKTLSKNGFKIFIACWDRDGKYKKSEMIDNIKVVRFRIPSSYGIMKDFILGIFKYYLEILRWARNKNFNYIHAHDFDTLPLAILLKKLHHWKVVYDVHDYYSSMISDTVPSKIGLIIKFMEKLLVRYTDARIAATKALGDEVFDTLNFVTIMNSKNLEEYNISLKEIQALRRKYNLQNKFVIVYIGILKIWEPIPQIIDAVKEIPDVYMLLGGDGPHRDIILEKIKGVNNIKYIGWVEKKDIPKYTLLSDVIVLPSDRRKDYTRVAVGNKIMEGLAAGKPIIAGLGTEGGRIVEECKCGILCDFNDIPCISESITYLKSNKNVYEEFSRNGKRCAIEKYNWDVMARRLVNIYNHM